MIKLGCGAVSLLCLLAAGILLWLAPETSGKLPDDLGAWVGAWIDLFRDPASAVLLFLLCAALAVLAASISELLLGLVFAVFAGLTSLLCLLGVIAARYPAFAAWLENLFE
jgi:hypothetical protein